MNRDISQRLGKFGEQKAAEYLACQGYTICARNFTYAKGEIDIIARSSDTFIFVEVKTRSKKYFNVSEIITVKKQQKIVLTARHYIAQNSIVDVVQRFDIALLTDNAGSWNVEYIANAFTDVWSSL